MTKLMVEELGVQSYCFRGFPTDQEVINRIKACGISAVELCGVHADFTNESAFDKVISIYQKSGVRIVSIGVQTLAGDEKKEAPYFEFAKRAGARFMSVDFNPDRMPDCFRVAEKLADRYDIHLAIHNHGGRHWLGSATMLDIVFRMTSPRIGLCLDTAWALHSHEDPIEMSERFSHRLYGLHIKDFIFDRAGTPQDVVVGTGNLKLRSFSDTIKKIGFSGYWVLEYEGDINNPVPAIQQCVDQVRKEFSHD